MAYPVFDLHCDTADRIGWATLDLDLRFTAGTDGYFPGDETHPQDFDLIEGNACAISLAKIGNTPWAQCFATFVPDEIPTAHAARFQAQIMAHMSGQAMLNHDRMVNVRSAADIHAVRELLQGLGSSDIRLIAKIENREGIHHFQEILDAADGIMVARGDLGVEVPMEEIPFLQKEMIRQGVLAGKPVIVATQMLDSMIRNPRPTRAEVSDVANAVFDGTSCVMLSGETASGKYPIEALSTMVNTVTAAEEAIDYWGRFRERSLLPVVSGISDAITHSCCLTAMDLNASAILAATRSGYTAKVISRFRPACPIVALCQNESTRRQLAISWGVHPYLSGEVDSTDRMFSLAVDVARKENAVQIGDTVVITAGVPLGQSGTTNLIKAQIVEGGL